MNPEILVPQPPLWLFSFAADGHQLSCAFVLLAEGFSFDDAWLRLKAGGHVPPGHWDVVGQELGEAMRLSLVELDPDELVHPLEPGSRFTEEQATAIFGPRENWDWRVVDGPRRRALEEQIERNQLRIEEADTCEQDPNGEGKHDTQDTEQCTVSHSDRQPCRMCRHCFRWIQGEKLAAP